MEEVYNGNVFDWQLGERMDASWETTFDGYNNTKGVKVIKSGTQGQGFANMKSSAFEVVENKEYKLVYMVRGDNLEGNYYNFAQVYFYDKDGKQISLQRHNQFDHRSTSDEWQQVVKTERLHHILRDIGGTLFGKMLLTALCIGK